MRLSAVLFAALMAPALLAAQPLLTTDDRTAALGALLEDQLVAPYRVQVLPGDTLVWESLDEGYAYRIPLGAVVVYTSAEQFEAGLRCRQADCIQRVAGDSTRPEPWLGWRFLRKEMDASAPGGYRMVPDAELLERGQRALQELVAAAAAATPPPGNRTAAERLMGALWHPTRVQVDGDTLVLFENEEWTYRVPLSEVEVTSSDSDVGVRCREQVDCVRLSRENSSFRLREIGWLVQASNVAAAREALEAIVRGERDGG